MSRTVHTPPAIPQEAPPTKKMTCEEFLAWLDEDTRAEWVDGEVFIMSPVSEERQNVGGFLFKLISEFATIYQIGKVFYEPFQMKIGPRMPGRSPDILFVSNENLTRLQGTYLDGSADLVIEVVSPESRGHDRGDKFHEYEQGGVREYWLVDPTRKEAEFYRRGAEGAFRLVPIAEDGSFHSEVLPGFWLKVDWLWQTPQPTLLSVLKEWGLV